ncbi:hypothetical protein NKH77_50630 [Streptomyces sp. M19]
MPQRHGVRWAATTTANTPSGDLDMKRQRGIGRSSALALVLGLSGSLATAPAVADEPRTPRVRWDACPEDVVAEAAPTELRCATVPVPVDYTDPDGDRIDLMISRLASTHPDKRRGTLMLNPGGPGGSGLALPRCWWPGVSPPTSWTATT